MAYTPGYRPYDPERFRSQLEAEYFESLPEESDEQTCDEPEEAAA